MLESQIEQRLKTRLESTIPHTLCLKFTSPGFMGVPDRVVILPHGLVVWVELKRPKGTPRPRQKYVHWLLERIGHKVFPAVDTYEKVEEVVTYCARLVGIVWAATHAEYTTTGGDKL